MQIEKVIGMERTASPILEAVKVNRIERKIWPLLVEYRCVTCGMVFTYRMVHYQPQPKEPKRCDELQGGCARTLSETRFEQRFTEARDLWEITGNISRETYIIRTESEPVHLEIGDQIDISPSFIQKKRGTRQTWQCLLPTIPTPSSEGSRRSA